MDCLKIGVTMRISRAQNYEERRDTLASDWSKFLTQAMPRVSWLPIPNLGADSVRFARNWGVNALILTGGNDLGEEPIRDLSETHLLEFALHHNYPVVGICRGMQLIASHLGGVIEPCVDNKHRATEHPLYFENPFWKNALEPPKTVNSYHDHCIRDPGSDVVLLAKDGEGYCEAYYSLEKKILSLMWHPERYSEVREFDKNLIKMWLEQQR